MRVTRHSNDNSQYMSCMVDINNSSHASDGKLQLLMSVVHPVVHPTLV